MKQMTISTKQRGFTLIEVGIALAIGLAILLGVAKAIQVNQQRSAVGAAVTDIQSILQGAADYRSSRPSYTGLTMTVLNTQKLVPAAIGTGSGVNPWGGNYTAAPNSGDASKLDITITNVPTGISTQLESKLDPSSDGGNGASVSGTTVTVTY